MRPSNAQCENLLAKHGVEFNGRDKLALIAAIREAYRAGLTADVMQLTYKTKEKAK